MTSSDGIRLARHAERFGREAFPRFSDDDAVQWLVEEALMAKHDRHEAQRHEDAHRENAVETAQQRVRASLDAARKGQ